MIYIEPNKVDENANQIERLGGQMQTKMQEIDAKVKSIRSDWQDAVQETYDADFAKLVQSFESFIEIIPPYAKEAHEHADKMRRLGQG